jgi:hypothetical protein
MRLEWVEWNYLFGCTLKFQSVDDVEQIMVFCCALEGAFLRVFAMLLPKFN